MIRIWLDKNNRIEIMRDGIKQEIPLAAANIGRNSSKLNGWLIYNAWNSSGKNLASQLDMSTELSMRYTNVSGSIAPVVSLILDDKESQIATCESKQNRVKVRMLSPLEFAQRIGGLISFYSSDRTSTGKLSLVGVSGVAAGFRRSAILGLNEDSGRRNRFCESVATDINKIVPGSANEIEGRLSGRGLRLWRYCMTNNRYRYFPETTRYSNWIKEGVNNGEEENSIIAGFNSFVHSSAFKAQELRNIFAESLLSELKSFSDEDLLRFKGRLYPEAHTFLTGIWGKATGKKTLADYPDVKEMVHETAAIFELPETDFDPQVMERKLMAFFRSSKAEDPYAKRLYLEATAPLVKTLTPRQSEDVRAWLNDADKQHFDEMLAE